MPPLRGLNAINGINRAGGVMNGRPNAASALNRNGSPARRPSSADGESDILNVLKNSARMEPAAALRELQRLHAQLTGAAGNKALTSLESAWAQQGNAGPMPHGSSATANALTAQQRELNQLTIQRQRLQQQQREQRTELHSLTAELDKRKSELRQVTEQLKARRNVLKGAQGSPRPPSPPRGSQGGGGSSPGGGDGAGAPSSAASESGTTVPKLPVGNNAPGGGGGGGGKGGSKASAKAEESARDDEATSEKLEALQEELEDARGDLQLTISDLRVILEATPAFVCAVDPHGHVSGWNTAAIEITGLRRDAVLQKHFVEHFVPQASQQGVADAMEAAFSLPPDDPLASEPGEPFDLTLWRGGTSERTASVTIKVRAYARRLAGGQPVGLLLIQEDAASNDGLRERTNTEREVVELQGLLASREQELEEHEAELARLRAELQEFYKERARESGRALTEPAGTQKPPPGILSKGAAAGQPGSGQRVAWGAPNKVGHFTKGSSPREFGNKQRHDVMRAEALGTPNPQQQQMLANPPTR